jgi:hypothetical protein
MSADMPATIIWACLSFFLAKVISQGFVSTTTSPNNNEGAELFQIGKNKTGSRTYDTVYVKDANSVVVSSGRENYSCITIIDIGYVINSCHITVDDITYRFITKVYHFETFISRTVIYCSISNRHAIYGRIHGDYIWKQTLLHKL